MEDYADLMEAVKEVARGIRVVHAAPGMMESVDCGRQRQTWSTEPGLAS